MATPQASQRSDAGIDYILTHHPLLQKMDDRAKDAIRHIARFHSHKRGDIVFMADDEANLVYVTRTGWIKLFREALNGDEAIIDVLPPMSLCGEIAMFENHIHSFGVEVIENAEIWSFPTKILADEIEDNKAFAMAFMGYLARRGIEKNKEIELRNLQNAPQRIGCFLLRLCKQDAGPANIALPWEKGLIAARLGMKPETLSRSLAKLQEEGIIEVKGSLIHIPDISALVRNTCAACSNVYPCENH